jgi:transposase
MDRYIEKGDRGQLSILPMCLDEMIAEDNVVRAIDAIVDNMNVKELGFTHCDTATTGRKPYSPVDMFKLYTYSYFNGIRSSRKIERECYRNIELMWLLNELKPDFKTIADFRKDNKKQIKLAFRKFSMICDELGLIGKEMVAVDGSKFRASNSRLAYHSEKKIEKKIEHFNNVAEKYIALLDNCDNQENASGTSKLTRDEIQIKIENIDKRLLELEKLKKHVHDNGSIYENDKDSRMMKTNNNGCDICHNVQVAVDDTNHLVVAVDVSSHPIPLKLKLLLLLLR